MTLLSIRVGIFEHFMGEKNGVRLETIPPYFSMCIKCGIFEHTKKGVVGDLVMSQSAKIPPQASGPYFTTA